MINFIINHYQEIIVAMNAIFVGLTGLFLLIPGEQPEKTFQWITDLLSKISRK